MVGAAATLFEVLCSARQAFDKSSSVFAGSEVWMIQCNAQRRYIRADTDDFTDSKDLRHEVQCVSPALPPCDELSEQRVEERSYFVTLAIAAVDSQIGQSREIKYVQRALVTE